MEAAPGRRVRERRRVSPDRHDRVARPVETRDRPEEPAGVRMLRVPEDGPDLCFFHHFACIHHGDPVGDLAVAGDPHHALTRCDRERRGQEDQKHRHPVEEGPGVRQVAGEEGLHPEEDEQVHREEGAEEDVGDG